MAVTHSAFTIAFLTGLSGLAFNRTHLLSALLCLEAMMLSLFLGLSLWMLQLDISFFATTPILLLAFSVCEASAGLALLVATMRTHGSDRLNNLNLLQC
uniref:NADH-ubiquinone oxidoreductase chain 4L n=1 Tax=Ostorhinchus novemfasciatus TaxID=316370 RepID=A0A7L8Y4I3_9TELE|nr:NADH dehydrogenase subunit 4L [Ostorhinchus novemfasciatus]YP_010183930.1 NADH dehydrogenase subunit 4L [Ostorhinchus fasciatus]YP_010389691.1 NADH dehydrogenase subunit 4L [Ostorhinchus pleuron]QOI14156.1 NADH dehydrogenase subunit 4L [Ostorhinchus novemfasciatus]QVG62694.1 NADH dehydrogenase subunit 4L [Ostorhinchus fasciatus]UPT34465.1 NADH dehydrogenase subunit 4L [Ostorhinchus pleuron]